MQSGNGRDEKTDSANRKGRTNHGSLTAIDKDKKIRRSGKAGEDVSVQSGSNGSKGNGRSGSRKHLNPDSAGSTTSSTTNQSNKQNVESVSDDRNSTLSGGRQSIRRSRSRESVMSSESGDRSSDGSMQRRLQRKEGIKRQGHDGDTTRRGRNKANEQSSVPNSSNINKEQSDQNNFFDSFGGFPSNVDNFETAFGSFPAADTGNKNIKAVAGNEFSLQPVFENFSEEDTRFEDFSSTFPVSSSFADGALGAFDQMPIFPSSTVKQPEKIKWDTSPLKDPLTIPNGEFTVSHEVKLKRAFVCSPVSNPMNGNLIFCFKRDSVVYIEELDMQRKLQVNFTCVLTNELRRKVALQFDSSVYRLKRVWGLQSGLHYANGRIRLRVAAFVELAILESSQCLTLLAVWRWGYGTPLVGLQYVLALPNDNAVSIEYNTLRIADNLLFVSGSTTKESVMYMCKPTVSENWHRNSLINNHKVLRMSLLDTVGLEDFPYIAIAFSDKSISVWTFKQALSVSAFKDTSNKRYLLPLCKLDYISPQIQIDPVILDGDRKIDTSSQDVLEDCSDIVWLPTETSLSPMKLLAIAFKNGFAVFHVDLPVTFDLSSDREIPLPDPSQTTHFSSTPNLLPISLQLWQKGYSSSSLTWNDLGPLSNPSLIILLYGQKGIDSRLLAASLEFLDTDHNDISILPSCIFANRAIPFKFERKSSGLLRSGGFNTSVLYNSNDVSTLSLTSNDSNHLKTSIDILRYPVTSLPPGLSSTGDPLSLDNTNMKEEIFFLHKLVKCERRKVDSQLVSLLEWNLPFQSYWVCKSDTGDIENRELEEKKEDQGFEDAMRTFGGTETVMLCELFHEGLIGFCPFRILRSPNLPNLAVFYHRPYGIFENPPNNDLLLPMKVALINTSNPEPIRIVVEGRDLVFIHKDSNICTGALLSTDGSTLSFFSWDCDRKYEVHKKVRPIVGVKCDKDYIECRRLIVFSDKAFCKLAVVGKKFSTNRVCFAIGEKMDLDSISVNKMPEMVPNIVTGNSFWLHEDEDIISATGLEVDENGCQNIALATTQRVLLLGPTLTLLSEKKTELSSSNLAPIGTCTVCFIAEEKIQYLCLLPDSLRCDVIASLSESRAGLHRSSLIAVRPDRIILLTPQSSASFVGYNNNLNSTSITGSFTRPVLLLEPLVANAVCMGSKRGQSFQLVRTVIERFGRKVASITHAENEGIGQLGAGITDKVFSILKQYGLKDAASWLLTGSAQFERSSTTTILPQWLPMSAKSQATFNADGALHVLASGDSHLLEYIKSPDHNMVSALPGVSDPISHLSREAAELYLAEGKVYDAVKMLDFSGSPSSEFMLLQLALILEQGKQKSNTSILKLLSQNAQNSKSFVSSLAALATLQKERESEQLSDANLNLLVKALAPSVQSDAMTKRVRQSLIGESILKQQDSRKSNSCDKDWSAPCNESRHMWNEGPRKNQGLLLSLDRVEDWLGRRRPLILGRDGVSTANERGEKKLASILNQDEDYFCDKSDDNSVNDMWVEGVGEGRSDEANLSGYFRFIEGDDEECKWRNDGMADLSPYQNKAFLFGDPDSFSLLSSTTNIDEGEPGKVKVLYDLVCDRSGVGVPSGLALTACRGGSLDIGLLHTPLRDKRKKCTIEFWYYLSSQDTMPNEIILVRRTIGESADDFPKSSLASNTDCVLWECAVTKSGELIFRSCGGTVMVSSTHSEGTEVDDETGGNRINQALFEKWNHACLVLSSSGTDIAKCAVKLLMKGVEVASCEASVLPPGVKENDVANDTVLNDLLQKSHLLFGLNHNVGFRLTELRIWACTRRTDDVQFFLHEYLTAAEQKKKFQVKISSKNKKSTKLGFGSPKGLLDAPNKGDTIPNRGMIPMKSGGLVAHKAKFSKPEDPIAALSFGNTFDSAAQLPLSPLAGTSDFASEIQKDSYPSQDAPFNPEASRDSSPNKPRRSDSAFLDTNSFIDENNESQLESETDGPITLWDTAIALSKQIRASAAAALIRGPPATRHYGGNRGGLPDFSGVERFGVGGIAICGSEKTIVFRDNEDPPALTYPIGASGAIVSDQMDDEGSEFLCCFLAKEKRMVVFELRSRTVVVELQMTTKLNYWRYLPPEAAENTLCFMLVTPVGGFHWMPLEESPRPHQVWKRGSDLQGKKIVGYEEGGSNGLDDHEIRSRVGLVMATQGSGGGCLEAWIVPIAGDSHAQLVSNNLLGACLCQPVMIDDGPFLPLLVSVHGADDGIVVNLISLQEPNPGSIELKEVVANQELDTAEYDTNFDPPPLAMGTYPEVLCVSLSNIIVVILRRKGIITAFEQEEDQLNLIAQECVDHFVIDAVMRYSAEVGGAEIVMLLSDCDDPKDGRIVSFCFRSAA